MSGTGQLPELESLRSQVADLARELAEQDQAMQARQQDIDGELQDLRKQSDLLQAIMTGTAADTGDTFFASLATHLTATLNMQYAVIGEMLEKTPARIRTLAVSSGGTLLENFEYDLATAPCRTGLTESSWCFEQGVQALFPNFPPLAAMGVESHSGVAIRNHQGKVVGLIVVMDTKPIASQDRLQTLLKVFAPRAAAELHRKHAEHEHRQTLHELQNIMETVPDFMFTLDSQGNMVKWNRHVEEVTGYSPEELHGKSALDFVPAHEQEHTALAIQRAFTDGKAELEGHLLTKDQRTIPYHWTGAVLKNPQGRIIGITGIGRDVSAQKQAAEALQRQRQHLLEAQALAHLGSWEWDIESGETDWSEEQFRIFGYEPGTIAVTYDTFLAALLPDDHDRVLAAINDALLGKRPLDLECRIVRPNGDIRVIHMRADVQRDATAHPIGMAGTALDITEPKQTEEALRASEERWHLAVQGSNDGIWDWNIQAGEIFFSARWKAMRGFADHEVRNHIDEWRSRIHPDDLDRVLQSIDLYLAKQTSAFCEEYRVQRKDSSYMWILDRGVALWAEDGTPVRMAGSETDITDRKRTEELLRESVARFDLAVQGSQDGLWHAERVSDNLFAPHNPIYYSPRMKEIMGVEDDAMPDVLGTWLSLVHPDDLPTVLAALTQHLEQRLPYDVEYRILQHGTGTLRWIGAKGQAVWDSSGQPIRMAGSFSDITERKRAEEALRTSQEKLQEALRSSHTGLWDWNTDTNETSFSREWKHQLGYEETELADTFESWESLLHPEGHDRIIAYVQAYLASPKGNYQQEFRLRHKDGTYRWIEARAAFVTEPDGRRVRLLGSHSDVTERKQIEEALRESEERYRTLVELSPSGVFVFSEGRTVYVNSMAMTILGATEPNDILARSPFEFIHPDYHEDVTTNLRLVLAGETTVHRAERVYLKMDGTPIHVQVEAVRIAWNGKTAIQGFFSDITDRKRAEQALATSERQLRTVLDSLPIGVWFTDEKGHVLYGNPVGHRIWAEAARVGLPQPGSDGLWWETIAQPESPHRWAVGTVLARGHDVQNETLAIETSAGERRTIRNTAVPVKGDAGEMLGAIVLNEDITDRVRAENALHQEHALLMAVMDAATDIIFVKDLEGRYIHINRAGARALGMPVEEVIGWNDYAIWPTDLAASCQLADRRVLETGEPVTVEETSVCDGVTTIYLTTKAPYRNSEGQIIGVIGVARDITERKRAEQALRDSEERYRSLVDGAPIGIYVNENGLFSYLNKEMVRILRADCTEDLIGTHVMERIAPEYHQVVRERIQTLVTDHKPVPPLDERYVCTDGSQVDVAVTAIPAPFGGATAMQVLVLDITERKRAEEALRASEERFAKAFRSSPYPIVISELESGLFIESNDAAYQAFGYHREDVANRTSTELHLWPTPDHRMRFVEELQQAGAIRNLEIDLRMRNGELRHCLVSAEQIELHGKRCMVTVGTDITEQKRAEEALREQHALLSAIMNTTMDIIFVKDLQGHYLHMNPAGARAVGLSPQEVIGKDDDAIWPADLAACCKEADRLILSTGSAQTIEESSLANGSRITYLTTKAPYRDAAGNMIGIIGVAHDISQIKQSEEDLRRSHAFIRQIIDTDPNFIFAKDREGRFTLVNKAVAEAYGTSVERLIGKTDADFNSNTRELEFFRKKDLEVLDSLREQYIPEEIITDAAGRTRWLQTVKRPILDESGKATMVLGASTDITERKRMEETLRQRERDLRTALDERERISQDLHDGILQSLYAIGLGLEACKPLMTQRHYKKAAASMDRAIGQLNHVMSEVRNFIAGLESQILQGSTFPMALRAMVQTLTADHLIPCTLMLDESLADTFSTEQALHLLNIVREALSNSLRHAEATQTTVSLKSLSRSIRLTIADNGRGFNPASMHGAGHGLANMEARARKVGGRFAIRSAPQRGTRITIDLPKRSTEGDSPCRK